MPPKPSVIAPVEVLELDLAFEDEEAEEKTRTYEKEATLDALATLKVPASQPPQTFAALPPAALGSVAADGSLRTPSILPPPPVASARKATTEPPLASAHVAAIAFPRPPPIPSDMSDLVPTEVVIAQAPKRDRRAVGWLVIGAAAIAASALVIAQPRQGTVVIAAKHAGRALTVGDVVIDDVRVCTSLPCRAPAIDGGTHAVRVHVAGYRRDIELVTVRAGEDAPLTFELSPEVADNRPTPPALVATAIAAPLAPEAPPPEPEKAPIVEPKLASPPAAPKTEANVTAAPRVAPVAKATLTLDSTPPSKCVLDGRPLGATPRVSVSVSAGRHTVVFLNPGVGRKAVSVWVNAGESRTVSVKLR